MSLAVRPPQFGKVARRPCRTVVNQGIERVIDSARSWIELCSQENYTNAIIDWSSSLRRRASPVQGRWKGCGSCYASLSWRRQALLRTASGSYGSNCPNNLSTQHYVPRIRTGVTCSLRPSSTSSLFDRDWTAGSGPHSRFGKDHRRWWNRRRVSGSYVCRRTRLGERGRWTWRECPRPISQHPVLWRRRATGEKASDRHEQSEDRNRQQACGYYVSVGRSVCAGAFGVHCGPLDRDHLAVCLDMRSALLAAHLCDQCWIPSIFFASHLRN